MSAMMHSARPGTDEAAAATAQVTGMVKLVDDLRARLEKLLGDSIAAEARLAASPWATNPYARAAVLEEREKLQAWANRVKLAKWALLRKLEKEGPNSVRPVVEVSASDSVLASWEDIILTVMAEMGVTDLL